MEFNKILCLVKDELVNKSKEIPLILHLLDQRTSLPFHEHIFFVFVAEVGNMGHPLLEREVSKLYISHNITLSCGLLVQTLYSPQDLA